MKGRNVNRNSNKYVSLYTISQTKNASYHYLQFKTGLLLIPSVFFSFLWLNDLSYTAKVSVWCLSEEVNNSQFPTSTNATMHSVKPCPHWRLQSPNLATVAVSVTVAEQSKFGDCRQIRRQIVAVSGDYSRRNRVHRAVQTSDGP